MSMEEMSIEDLEHLAMICNEARRLKITPIEYMEKMRVAMRLLGLEAAQ